MSLSRRSISLSTRRLGESALRPHFAEVVVQTAVTGTEDDRVDFRVASNAVRHAVDRAGVRLVVEEEGVRRGPFAQRIFAGPDSGELVGTVARGCGRTADQVALVIHPGESNRHPADTEVTVVEDTARVRVLIDESRNLRGR